MIGWRSIRFVECTQCHRLTTPGGRECPHCKASFPKNSVVHKFTFQDTDEMVEAFISCPGCSQLLDLDKRTCPACGTTITDGYAARSVEANVTVAQAYVLAQRIESFNPGIWLMLALAAGTHVWAGAIGLTPLRWFLLLPLACCILAFLTIMRWFRRFGSYESDDEEFAAARHKVKGSFRLLIGVVAAQVIGLAVSSLLL